MFSLMSPSVVITEEVANKLLDVTLSPGDVRLGVVRQVNSVLTMCLCALIAYIQIATDGLIVSLNTQVMAHVPRLLISNKLKVVQ